MSLPWKNWYARYARAYFLNAESSENIWVEIFFLLNANHWKVGSYLYRIHDSHFITKKNSKMMLFVLKQA